MHGPPLNDLDGFVQLLAELQARLPPRFVLIGSQAADREDDLYPVEREHIAGAIDSRRREFATGRALAREALGRLGLPPIAIPAGAGREPVWPPGVVGSITHSAGFCAVLLGLSDDYRGLGIDVELSGTSPSDIASLVVSAAEPAEYKDAPLLQIVFSAKEAVYKCVYPTHRDFIGFQDVTVSLDITAREFSASPLASAVKRTGIDRGHGLFASSSGAVVAVFSIGSSARAI